MNIRREKISMLKTNIFIYGILITFGAAQLFTHMPKDINYLRDRKIDKNLIVHHYEYLLHDAVLEKEISELRNALLEKIKQRNARSTIYLPKYHDVLNLSPPFLKEGIVAEWDTNFINSRGEVKGKRELVYITEIRECSNMTGKYDTALQHISNISIQNYVKLECTHFDDKSILRLSGIDAKELLDKHNS